MTTKGSMAMSPVIVTGWRTPFGKWKGNLADLSAKELGTHVVQELLKSVPEAKQADGVILAEVIQAGQGQNPARQVAAEAGVSLSTPAITLNNVCLGGLASAADASRRIVTGEGELFITGGFDSMTNAPYTAPFRHELGFGAVEMTDTLFHDGLRCALTNDSMGVLSDRKNRELRIDREAQDAYAQRSQARASEAERNGKLSKEIAPIHHGAQRFTKDEGIRHDSSLGKLAGLRPAFSKDGTITAGNASQMSDGASAGIIASEVTAHRIGKEPLARILGWAEVAGPDASLHLKPAHVIRKLLDLKRMRIEDIDLFEINEAFASVVIASIRELGLQNDKVNVNGGAIAIGHPLAGTGFRLLLTLAHELKRRGGGKGIASLCGGGGQGTAVLIEVPSNW
ncbi:MAG TPA: acetyl-CoA C-acyltransferase [Bacillales bacterium]|nr:acetyl-CoA C-acyltransferase [Bacillales bacterium]